MLGIFCVEIAKNASGEVVDYDSGTDLAINNSERTPFSGGKRVLVDRLLSRQQTWRLAAIFYLAAIAIGLSLVWWRDWQILGFGIPGMTLAWFYHGGFPRLAYRGLGELAVALAYGPLVVCGTYFVQTGYLSAALLHVSCALGLLIAAFLWINQFPDCRADKQSGKRNLVVRLGPRKAAIAYVLLLTSGFCWLASIAWSHPESRGFLWGLGALPMAGYSAWRLLAHYEDIPAIIPAQVACLAGFLTLAVAAGLGYLLS